MSIMKRNQIYLDASKLTEADCGLYWGRRKDWGPHLHPLLIAAEHSMVLIFSVYEMGDEVSHGDFDQYEFYGRIEVPEIG